MQQIRTTHTQTHADVNAVSVRAFTRTRKDRLTASLAVLPTTTTSAHPLVTHSLVTISDQQQPKRRQRQQQASGIDLATLAARVFRSSRPKPALHTCSPLWLPKQADKHLLPSPPPLFVPPIHCPRKINSSKDLTRAALVITNRRYARVRLRFWSRGGDSAV